MSGPAKRIAVLGSTGSIGASALDVIASSDGRLEVAALSAHRNCDALLCQARQHRPSLVVVSDAQAAAEYDWSELPDECQLLAGDDGLVEAVGREDVDVVLAAIVGSAGLRSTWAALEAGKTVALANKETLVMAGALMAQQARDRDAMLLPVDSEHSALFQILNSQEMEEVDRLVLTASGGPFRHYTPEQLQRVTVQEALEHPTWQMGPKISVDSATMMNKALEIIEARWLFGIDAERIEVTIHPQSIVHSLVEFVDGSVLAQMSPPDMRLPIHYALNYPQRCPAAAKRIDWKELFQLDFEPPNHDRFPSLEVGAQCAREGGSCGAVLNAANEAAVGEFLAGELHFTEIVPACSSILGAHHFEPNPTLDRLIELDRWARAEVSRWICA